MRIGISTFSSALNSGKQMMELEDEADVRVAERHDLGDRGSVVNCVSRR